MAVMESLISSGLVKPLPGDDFVRTEFNILVFIVFGIMLVKIPHLVHLIPFIATCYHLYAQWERDITLSEAQIRSWLCSSDSKEVVQKVYLFLVLSLTMWVASLIQCAVKLRTLMKLITHYYHMAYHRLRWNYKNILKGVLFMNACVVLICSSITERLLFGLVTKDMWVNCYFLWSSGLRIVCLVYEVHIFLIERRELQQLSVSEFTKTTWIGISIFFDWFKNVNMSTALSFNVYLQYAIICSLFVDFVYRIWLCSYLVSLLFIPSDSLDLEYPVQEQNQSLAELTFCYYPELVAVEQNMENSVEMIVKPFFAINEVPMDYDTWGLQDRQHLSIEEDKKIYVQIAIFVSNNGTMFYRNIK